MNDTYIEHLLKEYKNKGVIIDSGLLLLYFIGKYDVGRIKTFKRTEKYSEEEFLIISNLILGHFSKILTTPNILTEISNLSGQLSKEIKLKFYETFKKEITILHEKFLKSKTLCKNKNISTFGLTDISIKILANKKYLIITDDLPFVNFLQNERIPVINWNHIKMMNFNYSR